MKRKLLLTLAVLLGIGATWGQESDNTYHPLVANNKQWNVMTSGCWFPPEPQTRLTRIYKISDEEIEIEGLVYKKIYATSKEDLTNWYYAGVIYETPDKKVYAKDAAFSYEDYPFYDFSLSEGDTFPVDPYIGLYLERLSDTTINGETRKKFTFQYLEYGNPVNGYKEIWVEGIGSELGLLDRGTRLYDCEYSELLCSFEDGIKVWDHPYSGNCFFSTDGTEETFSKERLYAYTNPTNNIVTIYGANIEYAHIYNMLGQCIETTRTNIINIQNLPNGIYYILVITKDKEKDFIKIVKK